MRHASRLRAAPRQSDIRNGVWSLVLRAMPACLYNAVLGAVRALAWGEEEDRDAHDGWRRQTAAGPERSRHGSVTD